MNAFFRKTKTPLPLVNKKTGSLVQNDKLIVAVGAEVKEIEPLIVRFCKLYNRNDYQVEIKLHPIEEKIVALSFPNDMDFVVFFYLVKHLNNTYDDRLAAKTLGWCTVPPIELTDPISKQVMIYTGDDKTMCLTTQENVSWKINFDRNRYESSALIQYYSRPPYTYLEVKHRDGYIVS